MKDISNTFSFELENLDRGSWVERVAAISEDFGHAEPVGSSHNAYFIDAGRTLLVSFESIASVRKGNDDDAPIGWQFVQSHGWSSLTMMSDAEVDWFRSPALFGYFDRLIDDGFFDDFDQVLFYGAGAAGYAAAAFSVAAPDARVLAIQPMATLAPDQSRWDRRFPEARRLDFSSRFGFAPMMVETASDVWVIHDPSVIEDAMHAQMFNGANTIHLTSPYIGPNADRAFVAMDILPELIEQAMEGSLTSRSFATLWRARLTHMPYMRTLFHRLDASGDHPKLLMRLCRKMSAGGKRPFFAKKLAELEAAGITV